MKKDNIFSSPPFGPNKIESGASGIYGYADSYSEQLPMGDVDRSGTSRHSISSASSSSTPISQTMSCSGSGSGSSPASSISSPSPSSPPFTLSLLPSTSEAVPKIEEIEDNNQPMDAPPLPSPPPISEVTGKRPRGRPRKHPKLMVKPTQKVLKGRSKTGCLTCRKRKKKCDEMKPECNNCIKNSVVCEGYSEKVLWQPGKQSRQSALASSIGRSLPTLIDGVVTQMDHFLLDHFTRRVSRILTLFDDDNNPFHDYLLPLAIRHRSLMHSLLALSSSHLSNTRGPHPDYQYQDSQYHHLTEALSSLRISLNDGSDSSYAATALVLCLGSICKGDTSGEYKPHLDAARHMLGSSLNQYDIPLLRFLYEFLAYHDVANSVTILNRPINFIDNYPLPAYIMQPDSAALLGVLDGLFSHMSKITSLRKQIRERRETKIEPATDYKMLTHAVAIDTKIREWEPAQPLGTPRYIAAQLYRQCTWVYLFRTIQPSQRSPKIQKAVGDGLEFLRMLPENSNTQSILLMPLFLLGCAAFDPAQRPEISQRFDGLHEWSGLRNIIPAHEVVKEVWKLMDSNDDASWDWEMIIQEMGYDFLVT